MSPNYDRQYRTVSTEETNEDDALGPAQLHRFCDNLNNYMRRVALSPFVLGASVSTGSSVTSVTSVLGATDERVILYLGRHFANDFYNFARFYLTGRMHVLGGSDSTTWKVVASQNLYVGPRAIDYSRLHNYTVGQVTIDSASWQRKTSYVSTPYRSPYGGALYFLLTATNSAAGSASTLSAFSVQPMFYTTELLSF